MKWVIIGLVLVLFLVSGCLIEDYRITSDYVKGEVDRANYCTAKDECVDIGGRSPLECNVFINKSELERISSMLDAYGNARNLCGGPTDFDCLNGKCVAIDDSGQPLDFKSCGLNLEFKCLPISQGEETSEEAPTVCGCMPIECEQGTYLIVSAGSGAWPDGTMKGIAECSRYMPP